MKAIVYFRKNSLMQIKKSHKSIWRKNLVRNGAMHKTQTKRNRVRKMKRVMTSMIPMIVRC
jgi:hypothetical protein